MDEFKARAEHEMQKAGREIMEKAAKDAKLAEDTKWDDVKETLYVGDSESDRDIDWVVDIIREHYHLPIKKS